MTSRIIANNGRITWAIIFEAGEEAAAGLLKFAKDNNLSASQFTGIGAFSEVELGFFELEKKDYKKIPIHEQMEVLSLLGDVSLSKGEPKVHAHVVLGKSDGSACGGHLVKAIVRPTLEIILSESPSHLRRKHDPATGLSLINMETQ